MGCIRSRTPGSHQLLYYVNGKQKSKTIKGTKRDAERMLREIERSIDQGTYEEDKPKEVLTVGKILEEWLADSWGRISVTSYQRYARDVRNWVMPAFGDSPLSDLGPRDIQSVYRQWMDDGASPRTIKSRHTVLHAALQYALRMELVQRNAASLVALPSLEQREKLILGDEEIRRLMNEGRRFRYWPHAALSLMTALRLGEVCGLKWADIQDRTIWVDRTVEPVDGGGFVIKQPKTRSSRRPVYLPDEAIALLNSLPRTGEYVFGTDQPPNPTAVCEGVRRLCRRLGFKLSMHSLRHSHASLLSRLGVNPKVVQERLGHSTIGMTMDTYTHLIPSQQEVVIDPLNEVFNDTTMTR